MEDARSHPLRLRPGQGLRHSDHPRQRRRRRGLPQRGAAGDGVPRPVPPGRADRPGRLPPPRPQRGRRAGLHPAGDVRADQGAARPCGSVYARTLVAAGRAHRRRRPTARRARPTSGWWTSSRRFKASMGQSITKEHALRLSGAGQEVDTALSPEFLAALNEQLLTWPEGFTVHPKLSSSSSAGAPRWGPRAGSTGRTPKRWRSPRCSPRACRSGSPARTPSAAPSASGTWCCTTPNTGRAAGPRSSGCPARWRPSSCTTARSRELATLGLRVRLQRGGARGAGALGGAVRRLHQRRPGHRRPVPRRPGSPSGGSPRGSPCSCRTATRARGRSTRARGWSASSSSRPRATSGWPTPRRRRSTSTCSAGRPGGPASGRSWS